jgi:hypothetical protein
MLIYNHYPANQKMAIQFLIEHVVKEKGHPHIIAKLLSKDKNFSLTEKSFLGNLEIEDQIVQPRALDFEGKPRLDLFVFRPKKKIKYRNLSKE